MKQSKNTVEKILPYEVTFAERNSSIHPSNYGARTWKQKRTWLGHRGFWACSWWKSRPPDWLALVGRANPVRQPVANGKGLDFSVGEVSVVVEGLNKSVKVLGVWSGESACAGRFLFQLLKSAPLESGAPCHYSITKPGMNAFSTSFVGCRTNATSNIIPLGCS